MAKKTKGALAGTSGAAAKAANPNQLDVPVKNGRPEGRCLADVAIEPAVSAAYITSLMSKGVFGVTGVNDLTAALRDAVQSAKDGDLSEYEGMLGAQAYALNAIFLEMTRRAAINLGNHLQATEQYMRLALKAQSQARTTIETLAEVKNPRAVAFVRQANIANGPQQVNNVARGEDKTPPNELREEPHVAVLDARAAAPRLGTDPVTATVVEIDRAAHARRKG